jgi:hypothetical protein
MKTQKTDDPYDEEPAPPSDRSIGLVFASFFAIVACVLWYSGKVWLWALAVSAAFGAIALLYPAVLGPLNRVWMKFGLLLHNITNPIVLGALFFLVVLPVGLLRRAFGADPLRLRRRAGSYWIERPEGEAPVDLKEPF